MWILGLKRLMVTLGKWQGDRFIQSCDHYIQVNFVENIRQLEILGSCTMTVIYSMIAIYRAVIYRLNCSFFLTETYMSVNSKFLLIIQRFCEPCDISTICTST